jgi:hypothetical protein
MSLEESHVRLYLKDMVERLTSIEDTEYFASLSPSMEREGEIEKVVERHLRHA